VSPPGACPGDVLAQQSDRAVFERRRRLKSPWLGLVLGTCNRRSCRAECTDRRHKAESRWCGLALPTRMPAVLWYTFASGVCIVSVYLPFVRWRQYLHCSQACSARPLSTMTPIPGCFAGILLARNHHCSAVFNDQLMMHMRRYSNGTSEQVQKKPRWEDVALRLSMIPPKRPLFPSWLPGASYIQVKLLSTSIPLLSVCFDRKLNLSGARQRELIRRGREWISGLVREHDRFVNVVV
jgi:hypothetical protein